MGGLFGCVSKNDCLMDLFYGTDYHSHLGTKRGGTAVKNSKGYERAIHNIENDYFRSKFEPDLSKLHGKKGIGIISDYDAQPLRTLVSPIPLTLYPGANDVPFYHEVPNQSS